MLGMWRVFIGCLLLVGCAIDVWLSVVLVFVAWLSLWFRVYYGFNVGVCVGYRLLVVCGLVWVLVMACGYSLIVLF